MGASGTDRAPGFDSALCGWYILYRRPAKKRHRQPDALQKGVYHPGRGVFFMFLKNGKMVALLLPKILINFVAALQMGVGISLYYTANLGADPYSTFLAAISAKIGLSVGATTSLFSCVIGLIFLLFRRKLVHVGTFIQSIFVGVGIDIGMWLWPRLLPAQFPFAAAVAMCFCASAICGTALALYLACELGASPVDMLILTVAEWLKKSYKWGFYFVYAVFMLTGILLGGRRGLGTVIALVCTGPITDFLIPRIKGWLEKRVKQGAGP